MEPRRRPDPRKLFAGLALGALALGLVATVALFLARSGWEDEIAREIAAIEASGAPVRPEDLTFAPSTGAPWWETIETSSDPFYDLGLEEPEALEALLERSDAELVPFPRTLLVGLDALFEQIRSEGGSADDAWALTTLEPWPSNAEDELPAPLVLLRFRLEAAATRELVAAASVACEGGRFDSQAWIDRWLEGDSPVPVPDPVLGPLKIQRSLARQAWLAALDGDEGTAFECTRLGFCAARAFEDAPGTFYNMVWCSQTSSAIRALTLVARFLPDADLSEFEPQLLRLDPRAHLVRSIEEERALGQRVFTRPGEDGLTGFDGGTSLIDSMLASLFVTHDFRVYLRTHAQLLEAAQHSLAEASAAYRAIEEQLESEHLALRTRLLTPHVWGMYDVAVRLEIELTFARALLLGRREGLDAARTWVEAQVDPCSGAPFRTEVDADGRLRVWSVGFDGIDDDGEPEQNDGRSGDITVRIRPAATPGPKTGR